MQSPYMLVQGNTQPLGSRLGTGKRCGKYGVGTEALFIWGTVQPRHALVESPLIRGILTAKALRNFLINVFNCSPDTFSPETSGVLISKLQRFAFSCRGTGWNSRAPGRASCERYLCFQCRKSSGVKNLSGSDLCDQQ